jgi:hypothetical protein
LLGWEGFRVRVWTRLEEREKEEVGSGVPVRCGRKQAGRRRERRGEHRDGRAAGKSLSFSHVFFSPLLVYVVLACHAYPILQFSPPFISSTIRGLISILEKKRTHTFINTHACSSL